MAPNANLAFEALADPNRRAILTFLAGHGESSVGDIAAEVSSLSRTAVSSHLRILRAAGLVSERRDGRFRLYSVEPGAADGVVTFLQALYRGPLAELKRRVGEPGQRPGGRRGAGLGGDARTG